jgi:hypothetical protein
MPCTLTDMPFSTRAQHSVRASLLFVVVAAFAAGLTATATGSGAKPVIGPPVASPSQPQAGSTFRVAFHVAHAGSAVFTVTLGGKPQHHTDSFRGGVARTSIVLAATAGGKPLGVQVTARSGTSTVTKRATFTVGASTPPSLSIDDVATPEGNSGTTPLSFKVTLSHAATKAVSVNYTTGDETATAPSDYVAAKGTLAYSPGETTKTIVVSVVGDTTAEEDEDFTVTLTDAVNATVSSDTAIGTITNDDTASPVTAGSYQGATQEGNYVFFTVTPNRTITEFRSNSLTENCADGYYLQGSVTWGSQQFAIGSDGAFVAAYSWSGSETSGGVEYTAETWQITGRFPTASTINGTIALTDELNYQGAHYSCSGSVTFSATLQG